MEAETLAGCFADPPVAAAEVFRAALQAMARPGRIETVAGARQRLDPPGPLSVAAASLVLTLTDRTTPVHLAGDLDCASVRDWITFQTGAPFAGPADCAFALGSWQALLPLDPYPRGTPQYPDRSATLIVEMAALAPAGARLSGPGIASRAALSLPETAAFRANARHFPLGLDFFFCAGDHLAALPRTTRVEDA